jgi:ferredoxin
LAVYMPVIDMDCDLCGKCVTLCPTGAIRFVELDEAVLLRKKMGIQTFICPVVPGKCDREVH